MNQEIRSALDELVNDRNSIVYHTPVGYDRDFDLAHDIVADYLNTLVDDFTDDQLVELESEIVEYLRPHRRG